MITAEQKKKIDELIEKLKITDGDRNLQLNKCYKVNSITELTQEQADNYIKRLEKTLEKKNDTKTPKTETEKPKVENPKTGTLTKDAEKTELAKPADTSIKTMNSFFEDVKGTILADLKSYPKDFNPNRYMANVMEFMLDRTKCDIVVSDRNCVEIKNALLQGARCDLEYGKEFHIISRKDKKDDYKPHFKIYYDYKGLEKMMYLHSVEPIRKIITNVVYKGDEFIESPLEEPPIIHHPKHETSKNEDIIFAYCVVQFKSGAYVPEVLTLDDIKAIRKSASTQMIWGGDFYKEMCRKSAIRRMQKHIPLNWGENYEGQKIWNEQIEIDNDFENPDKPKYEVVDVVGGENV